MALKHSTALAGVLLAAAVVAIGAFIAGTRIVSPADTAARTAPPPPSPILVPIERRVLSANIVTRGTARFGLPQKIALAPSALKPGPGLIGTLPARNADVREGAVLLTVSGRPVFVLRGALPAYRDLAPGLSGDDVRQLEQALARLGFPPGPDDGAYDQRTAEAVARWYAAGKWAPFGATREQLAALAALKRDMEDTLKARLAAETALTAAALAVDAALAGAELAVQTAATDLDAKRAAARRLAADSGRPIALEVERVRAAYANSAASAEYQAQIAERALVVLDPRQPGTARAAAEAKLDLARNATQKTRVEGEAAILAAERDAQLAREQAALADTALASAQFEARKSIQAARDARKLAEFDAAATRQRADRLAAELRAAEYRSGVQLPGDEIVFLPSLPVRVADLAAPVGAPASGPILSVTDYQLAVDGALPLQSAALVKTGMAVAIDEPDLGISATGVVGQVAAEPGTRGVDGYHVYFEVRVTAALPRLDGVSVRLTIPTQTTRGAVLAVPTSALWLAADGSSRIQIQDKGGFRPVLVKPGLAAAGFTEITPLNAALQAGQLVVVGYQTAAAKDAK
ncbi:peptidoglycan-binding domain-containing protein [Janthinobacterium fluminis]|uniref:Peptidoglycan-binding domain-containing protein n=1 Tax=Janthinobacterium fluminis TaxID=2987524 RepID=A0ABT5JVG0_9BURK|nr:peptidoglycan-binding domain-containing protein [Janthinobacterium fluminis]MDC8756619.1 peptidoglycan-binding domain-containing protein [Janthinobacterium fluminis]